MSDISYGQLVVISGINLDNDVISASQKAIAFASSNGMLATQPITGLSAETFNFNNDLAVGGDINLSSFDSSGNKVLILDSSKNITLSNITSTKLDYLDDVTSSIQSQLNTKAPSNAPTFTGGTTFSGTNTFTNTSTFTGPVNINNTLYANNSTTINADFYIKNGSTEKFKVTKTSGNVLTQGTLGVIGATTLSSSLTLGANLYSSGSYLNLEVTATDGYFRFRSNSTDIVRILANGSVGIGTITPSEKLHLKSDTDNEDVYIQLQSTGTEKTGIKMVGSTANIWYMQHDDANNTLGIGMDSNEFITINSSGNTSLLGNISLTGNLDISNQTFTVDSTTGNTRILGSLDVSGITTIGGKLNAPEIFYIDPAAIGDNTGTVIIMGNLQVDGSMTTINSTVVDISDRILVLASNSNGGLESNNAGIDVSGGGSIKYYTTNNTWKIDSNTDISGNTTIAGTLSVSGETVVDNSLIILGNIGVNTNAPTSALDISSTDALRIPVGTSSERPNVQKTGQVRYNTTTSQFEGYNNTSSWQGLGGVVDIDQDTKITAESNPLDDNDEIQIYTNGEERMRVDASGNVQLIKSDNRYVALDISATSAVLLPKGTTSQRPISGNTRMRSDISGAIRFNTDTSLCEIYTASEIWSGIPTYKTEQPPRLLYINKTALSETFTVNWSKFNEVYKDVFDGKSFPIYLQTFVDISFTDISGENSSGWKTIYIGNGNYNTSGSETTPLTEVSFNSVEQTTAQNTTGYSLSFLEKPSTVNLPIFNQDDLFDIRVYGVNNSGKSPNYIYIYGVGLKQTGEPGPVTISNIDSYLKTSFEMDLSFNLDNNDSSVTSGISITHYDISFNINGTKSLVTRNHSENLFKHWSGSTSLSKTDISLNGLFPGAQYEIQVRAKNALKFNTGVAPTDPEPEPEPELVDETWGWEEISLSTNSFVNYAYSAVYDIIPDWNYTPGTNNRGPTLINGSGSGYGNQGILNGNQIIGIRENITLSRTLSGLTIGNICTINFQAHNRRSTSTLHVCNDTLDNFILNKSVTVSTDTTGEARTLNCTFTITSESHTVIFNHITGGDNMIWLDNIHIYESESITSNDIPEPEPGLVDGLSAPASDGPAPTHLYKYGSFGPIVTSGFTNDGTNKYIDTSDLNSVSSSGLGLSLYGSANINCHIDGANNRTNRTIMNSNSYINLTGSSTFYVNYGKQGIDMNSNNDALVTATVNVKNKNGANSATLNYKRLGLASADTITFDSFEFSSPSAYTDEGDVSYNEGFVYSSSITCSTGHANNSLFNNDFTATTNEYYINYTIATTSNNNNGIISTGQTNVTNTTGSFYVDNYNSTPSVTFGSAPVLVVTSSTRLFGIPSVTQIQATAEFTVSNFANTIIPYSGGRHSRVESITKNSFSFDNLDETNVYDNNNYTKTYTKTSNVSSGRYDATSSNNFTISVFYLNNTNVSTVDTHTHTQTLPNIGKIFRDTQNTYSGNNLYFFNGSNTITGPITTNDSNFISTYASHISNILLYFNEKFVSGGFAATYDGVSISPFTDWSSGYAVSGADYSSYSSAGSGGYKWIAIDVTNKKSGNTIDLSTFKINGSSPVLMRFSNTSHVDGYEAYISHDGKFGALNSVSNSGATLWFNDSTNSNISDAKSINGALKNNGVDAFIDSTTSTTIYLIVGLVQDANSYFTFS